jgi:DNA-binding SARP family transcriptional activator
MQTIFLDAAEAHPLRVNNLCSEQDDINLQSSEKLASLELLRITDCWEAFYLYNEGSCNIL